MKLRERIAKLIYPEIFEDWSWSNKVMGAMSESSPIDLTRENLKLTPLTIDYENNLEKYDKEDYLVYAVDILENPMFQEEIKRIVFEQVNYIATQSPTDQSSLLARGTINGVSLLKERIMQYREIFEQKQKDRNDDVTGLVK